MFTFCFTSAAATQLRSSDRRNSTRPATVAVRSVKFALAVLALVAMSGTALAGGNHSGGFSGMKSGNSGKMFSQSNQLKFKTSDSFKVSGNNKVDTKKPIDLGKLNSKSTDKISKLPNNKVLDSLKLTGDKSDKIKLGSNDKMKSGKDKCDPCHKTHCCPWWYCWNYPTWYPLYGCGCGYYDVPVVYVREGVDLQLLAVRTLDSGDPEQQLGPAIRVWVRNNSAVPLNHPFNVLALAARGPQPTADLPQAGVRVDGMGAGETVALDIRLPIEANQPGLPMFHVVVDSHREISEVNETNNGLVINRSEVKPIELTQATIGQPTETIAND